MELSFFIIAFSLNTAWQFRGTYRLSNSKTTKVKSWLQFIKRNLTSNIPQRYIRVVCDCSEILNSPVFSPDPRLSQCCDGCPSPGSCEASHVVLGATAARHRRHPWGREGRVRAGWREELSPTRWVWDKRENESRTRSVAAWVRLCPRGLL